MLPTIGNMPVVKDTTSLLGTVVSESVFGRIHDAYSNSDLVALTEMEAAYQSGHQVLMMLDSQMLSNKASYNIADATTYAHWIVYEGGLQFLDAMGNVVSDYNMASRVRFRVYTWGCNPLVAYDNIKTFDYISISAFESNFYGYISVR